jgi:uncharacterized protein YegL
MWKKIVHVTFLVDRSGSMEAIRSDVIGGFNHFLGAQRAMDGECRLTVHQFDSGGFDSLFEALDISDVRDATPADFEPRGMTPLYDAIGRAITLAQGRAASDAGRNEQPLVVILTDGLENASHEYTHQRIFELIRAKEAAGWIFTYLGANQDAYAVSAAMGINADATQNYVADAQGAAVVFDSVADAVVHSRARLARGETVTSASLYEGTGKRADADARSRTKKKRPSSSWSTNGSH